MIHFKKSLKVEGNFLVWGIEAYNLVDLLNNSFARDIASNLNVLQQGFEYLNNRFSDGDREKIVCDRLTLLMRRQIVEMEITYLNPSFLASLSIS